MRDFESEIGRLCCRSDFLNHCLYVCSKIGHNTIFFYNKRHIPHYQSKHRNNQFNVFYRTIVGGPTAATVVPQVVRPSKDARLRLREDYMRNPSSICTLWVENQHRRPSMKNSSPRLR